ncbi:hypothetical protein YC2023_085578 [Brassica napus]
MAENLSRTKHITHILTNIKHREPEAGDVRLKEPSPPESLNRRRRTRTRRIPEEKVKRSNTDSLHEETKGSGDDTHAHPPDP